ncbi:MAG TPA: Sec-independent protein translocase protein TatB [Methyloceanibacter sp.]
MFDIGWSELLIIAVVAIVVVGPKDLPRLMRTFGHYAGKLRRAAADFQRQFEDAMRETELEEVKKAIDSVRSTDTVVDLKAPIDKPIMLPNPETKPAQGATNGKDTGAAEMASAEPVEPPVKRKRAAKRKTVAPEVAAEKATAPKTPRARKPKAEPKP